MALKVAQSAKNAQSGHTANSSVDFSPPTILPPQVQVPNTPSTLFSSIVKFPLYLSCEKNKKRPGLAHLKKNVSSMRPLDDIGK